MTSNTQQNVRFSTSRIVLGFQNWHDGKQSAPVQFRERETPERKEKDRGKPTEQTRLGAAIERCLAVECCTLPQFNITWKLLEGPVKMLVITFKGPVSTCIVIWRSASAFVQSFQVPNSHFHPFLLGAPAYESPQPEAQELQQPEAPNF